jgi:acyl carrier protein
MLERIAQDFGAPVRAIYHTAGVLSDHPLAQESPANFAAVAAPKLLGAWHLHLAARGLDLQRFVLFSSAAALIGTPGQGSYATANAGLDALAAARRGAGLPALSINWGPWGGTGMAARLAETGRQRMAAAGIAPLRAESAFDALFRLDAEPAAQALVMDVDWRTFLTRFPGAEGASLYRDLRPATATAAPTAADGTAPGTLVAHVAGQPAERRRGALFRQLQHRVAAILGRPSPDDIAPTQGFFALGMDSLTSMELRTGLQRDLGIPLPATLTFDYGSIEALADHLLGQVPAWRAPEPPPPAPANEALADLSEDELAAMLARELEN